MSPIPDRPFGEPVPTFWGAWATFFLSLGIFMLFAFAAGFGAFLYMTLTGQTDSEPIEGLLVSIGSLVAVPVCLGALVWLVRKRGASPADYFALRPFPARQLMFWIPLVGALLVASAAVNVLLGRPALPEIIYDIYGTAVFLPLLWLAVIVLAPVFEEILFRGFMFHGLAISRSPMVAIVVSSLMWAVVHLQYDWIDMSKIFAFGLVLGAARVQTGTVWVPVIMHAVWNFVVTVQVHLLMNTPG